MKKKITIGLFIDTFFPMIDGVTMVVDNYAKRLTKYADVIVFAPSYEEGYDDSKFNYKVVRCRAIGVPFLDYSLPLPQLDNKFKKILNDYKLDIVHIHSPATLGMIGIKYAKKHNVPLIGTMHSQYKQDIKRAVKLDLASNILTKKITKLYSRCDEVWTVNEEVARIFTEEYGYDRVPRIVYNATDMAMVNDKQEAIDTINNLYNLNKDDKILLFVGRINKLKNIFFIVDSLKILKDKGFKYKMLFVGNGQDEEELKEYIAKKGLSDNVILCGRVTDRKLLSYYYFRANLFLFPSLYDCNSIVQIEASSQKTPGLFLKGAATAAGIKDDINGYLSENSVNEYAERIIEIFDNKEVYKKVCENAYKNLYKNWDDTINEVYELYLQFIKGRK